MKKTAADDDPVSMKTPTDDNEEAAWHTKARDMLTEASPPFDGRASLSRIEARIRAEREWQAATEAARRPARRAGWFGGLGFALGAAAALAIVGLTPRGFWSADDGASLEALSGSAAPGATAGRAVFTVAFRPGVPLAEAGRLAQTIGGEFVGGPSALGLWRLAVPRAEREAALARLRASPLVEAVTTEP